MSNLSQNQNLNQSAIENLQFHRRGNRNNQSVFQARARKDLCHKDGSTGQNSLRRK
jgi:hypothetical protein